MSVSPIGIVTQTAPLRSQKIGQPEKLGRNAARTMAVSQGHVWTGITAAQAVTEITGIGAAVDARGDAIRARIWQHEDAAVDALRRGAYREALAEMHCARGLRAQYEELDAFEDGHRDACGVYAAGAVPHLKASAVIHAALLSTGGES